MTSTEQAPRTITTDGITITEIPGTDTYAVSGRRVAGTVTAVLAIDERGADEYRNGKVVRVPQAVTTTWFGSRSNPDNPPIEINGASYIGHYAMTATGRYVGANTDRVDSGKVTDNARAVLHAIGSAVATLHATPERIAARKLADADEAVIAAARKVDEATDVLRTAQRARTELRGALAGSAGA